MTLYTPVLFANENQEIARIALSRGWRVVHQAGTTLRMAGTNETIQMPATVMNIQAGSLQRPLVAGWNAVIAWIKRHVTQPMLVVGPNHALSDLALWAHAAHGWPHGAWLTSQPVALTPSALALLTSAEGMIFTDAEAETAFKGRWPAPVADLPDTAMVDLPKAPPVPAAKRREGVTNVLLVAYYAGPSPTVGVQRINYWFNHLAELSGGTVQVDLATATPWRDAPSRVHVVKDLGPGEAAQPGGLVEPWGLSHIDHINDAARSYSVTGGFWHLSLEKYFEERDDEYDVVIVTGNPFSYFEFVRYAKRRWYASTILDYRDPFARIPRITRSPEQMERATQDEIGWNFAADEISVVNDVCAQLVVNHNPAAEVVVISNGWDDSSPIPPRPETSADGTVRLVHAGQWYAITHPDALIAGAHRAGVELHQFGPSFPTDGEKGIFNHGRRSKQTLYEQMATMHCGVTFSSGHGFETPTKVFDYIALGLDVLVLFDGQREGSALDTMLGDTAGVYWVENTASAVADFLETYQPTVHTDPDRAMRFSRRTSTERLLGRIQKLGDHSYHPPAALGL